MSKLSTILTVTLMLAFVTVPLVVWSQVGDQFEVTQTVTGSSDVTPPSIPLGLTATPISTSRIDLVWDPSTDDVAVAGYEVFIDGTFLATTTSTSYSSVGLEPGTNYTYTVRAFDAIPNYSGFSGPASATTLTSGGGGGSYSPPEILDVSVEPETTTALVFWKTKPNSRSNVLWGLTKDYEAGSLSGVDEKDEHSAKLVDLLPGSTYYLRIEALDPFGRVRDVYEEAFETLSEIDTTAPASVIGFVATPQDDSIYLSWTNPAEDDLQAIRIVRSDKFFPDTPFAGRLIYEGLGSYTTDTEVEDGITYYYSAFARDESGNYSSPSVATARIGEEEIEEPFEEFPEAPEVPVGIDNLSLLNLDFIQDGKSISYLGTTVPIDGNKPLTVSMDYGDLPEVLKTIGVTLTDPTSPKKKFSFLLRIDAEKERYEAKIAPLGRAGKYAFTATILDFQNQKLKKLTGELLATAKVLEPEMKTVETPVIFIAILVLLLLLLLIIILILLKKKKEEEEEPEIQVLDV